jgi:N utilization substance protein A
MKSELLLAFNQICAERNLSREVVMEAICAAIVSAYRRDVGAPPYQNITAQIDLETGKTRIFAARSAIPVWRSRKGNWSRASSRA